MIGKKYYKKTFTSVYNKKENKYKTTLTYTPIKSKDKESSEVSNANDVISNTNLSVTENSGGNIHE